MIGLSALVLADFQLPNTYWPFPKCFILGQFALTSNLAELYVGVE